MRAAQLCHGAGAADLASASADHRAAIAQLIRRAAALLAEAGLGAPQQVMARVETTLVSAAGDPDLRPALRQGRLEHELAPRGFDLFAGETLAPRPVSDRRSATDVRPARESGGATGSQRPAVGRALSGPRSVEPAASAAPERVNALSRAAASAAAKRTQEREAAAAAIKRNREREAEAAAIKRNRERESRLTEARETVSQTEARAAQRRQQLESARRRVEELSEM